MRLAFMEPVSKSLTWKLHYGKRYLNLNSFIDFCNVVGLVSHSMSEFEEYEQKEWMYPAARLIMPEDYAHAFWRYYYLNDENFLFDEIYLSHHELEIALRNTDFQQLYFEHPIDKAWGELESLENPQMQQFRSWDKYKFSSDSSIEVATHFYNYWQIYELYQIRKKYKKCYQDYTRQLAPLLEQGDVHKLAPFFDGMSYFQRRYRSCYYEITGEMSANNDGWVIFNEQQRQRIEQAGKDCALHTLVKYGFKEDELYTAIKGMIYLHSSYEQSEKYKLAETLKYDIGWIVKLVGYAFSSSTDEVSKRVGSVLTVTSGQKTLDVLFPNTKKTVREKARKILNRLMQTYNESTQSYIFLSRDIDELLNFVEKTDLAIFEYALVELNETYFNRTSWFASESFLRLKALASFPESLMRTLVHYYGDEKLKKRVEDQIIGLGKINELFFKEKYQTMWEEYENVKKYRSASTASKFQGNVEYLLKDYDAIFSEDRFIGISLALTTLIRNFTSHQIVDKKELLNGQYVHCFRAILTIIFFIWKDAQRRDWI